MRTGELAAWIGYKESTVRAWTVEFSEYLSPTAQEGQRRRFSDHDQRVLAHVAALKADGVASEEIHAALKSLQADGWRNLPPMPAAPPEYGPIAMIPTSTAEERAASIAMQKTMQIVHLEEQVERLEVELERSQEQRADLQRQLTDAREALGEARGRLAAVEAERWPAGWWLRVVLVAVSLAAVLAVVLLLLARA